MKSTILFITILSVIIIQVSTQIKSHLLKGNKISYKSNQNIIRKTSEVDNYQPIRIFTDFSYLKYQSKDDSNLENIEKEIENSMNISVKTLKKLIKVIPLTYPINKISSDDLIQWGFEPENFKKSLLSEGEGVDADLVILLKFIDSEDKNLLLDNEIASISTRFILDEKTKRPIVGVIYINKNIDINKGNINIYLNSLFLHELTHILGFYYDLFQYFPGGLDKTVKKKFEERTNKEKIFITTSNVVEFAKKYYNCKEIDGVELEDQHNLKWSHWEARILLGEYMTSSPYTPEQVISEFTLGLLEDSGWYKVKYYTGGLMKFGKNKGCNFLIKDCLKENGIENNFKYEFCNIMNSNNPTCSLGRQSRTYCKTYRMEEENPYNRMGVFIGRDNTDYCPVNDIEKEEENNIYYVGNCKYGNGKYGTRNNFNSESLSLSNENFEEVLGEKYGTNSFCVLSSILPKENNDLFGSYRNSYRAVCYPMFCSSKSLTIQIYDQYIVCPREGGKIEINGKYKGFLLCPDYNLICTGTEFCNDMFDCVEKESLAKEEIYNYDYDINYDEEKIFKAEEIVELGNDGLCPKNCIQCEGGKKCINCLNGYSFITENLYDSAIECIKTEDINKEKYCDNGNGLYYYCGWKLVKETIDEQIKDKISKGNIKDIIESYIEKSKTIKKLIMSYKNDNISIIIYNGKGDNEIFENISSNDEKDIIKVLNEDYLNDNKKIKVIINNNGNYSVSSYDEEGNKLDIENECPKCINIILTKNDKSNNNNNNNEKKFGELMTNIILKNKINIYDSEDPIYNDICSNFTVSGIDIPLNTRKEIFLENDSSNKKKNLKTILISETARNSFEIFKCFKSGSLLLSNEGFFISLSTLCIQSICFILYLISNPKISLLTNMSIANPIGKNRNSEKKSNYKTEETGEIINKKDENENQKTEKNQILSNNCINEEEKIENNVMNIGNIDEDIVDEKNEVKLDKIKVKKLKMEINANEDIKTVEETDELNKNNIKTLNTNTCNNMKQNSKVHETTAGGNYDKQKDNIDIETFSSQGSINKKLNMKDKEIKEFEEKLKNNEKILMHYKNKKNVIEKNKEKNQLIPLDYLSIEKAIQFDKRSFGIMFWCIFSFKQPIVNVFSFIDILKITKSCIPIQMKIIRFLFMLILNIFINSMTLTQNYFKKKYEFFNEKYQIEESDVVKLKIDPLERLSYAMKNCFPEVILTFIICLVIQFIINFVFFGVRRELCIISINEKKENINKEVQKIVKKTKTKYIIFAFINLFLMILFFVYLTNFSNAYSGGALDYIGAGIWTFILLQIFPILSSLIISFLRNYGMKNKNKKMFKLSQVLLA